MEAAGFKMTKDTNDVILLPETKIKLKDDIPKCRRGHSHWHQMPFGCDYILGCVGVESAGFKTIFCCDIAIDQPMPENMIKINS